MNDFSAIIHTNSYELTYTSSSISGLIYYLTLAAD